MRLSAAALGLAAIAYTGAARADSPTEYSATALNVETGDYVPTNFVLYFLTQAPAQPIHVAITVTAGGETRGVRPEMLVDAPIGSVLMKAALGPLPPSTAITVVAHVSGRFYGSPVELALHTLDGPDDTPPVIGACTIDGQAAAVYGCGGLDSTSAEVWGECEVPADTPRNALYIMYDERGLQSFPVGFGRVGQRCGFGGDCTPIGDPSAYIHDSPESGLRRCYSIAVSDDAGNLSTPTAPQCLDIDAWHEGGCASAPTAMAAATLLWLIARRRRVVVKRRA